MGFTLKFRSVLFWCFLSAHYVQCAGNAIGLGASNPSFCSSASDVFKVHSFFRDTMKDKNSNVSPFRSGNSNAKTVKCPSDLNCDFSGNCAWSNSKTDNPICEEHGFFKVTSGELANSGTWKKLMGNSDVPKDDFIAMACIRDPFPVNIVSDVIPKQPGDGTLTLKYWVSPPTTLSVCVLLKSSGYKFPTQCTKSARNGKNSSKTFAIKGPIKEPFKIVIMASNFIVYQGSVAVIDKINYQSSLCRK